MVKKVQVSKEKKAVKASSREKKRWTETTRKEKSRKIVTVSEELLSKIKRDISKAAIITKNMIGIRHNLNQSVTENILQYFCDMGVISKVRHNRRMEIYSSVGETKKTPDEITS